MDSCLLVTRSCKDTQTLPHSKLTMPQGPFFWTCATKWNCMPIESTHWFMKSSRMSLKNGPKNNHFTLRPTPRNLQVTTKTCTNKRGNGSTSTNTISSSSETRMGCSISGFWYHVPHAVAYLHTQPMEYHVDSLYQKSLATLTLTG